VRGMDWSAEALDAGPGGPRIDHVAVAVTDTSKALEYYTAVLGLTVVHDEVADDPGTRLTYLDAGNVFIQLVEPLRDGPVRSFLLEHGEGLHHVCFAVADIEQSVATMAGQSYAAIVAGGRQRRACFLLDTPVGVAIELTEASPSLPVPPAG
jgi:methylmalonyl-CoA/ethylmalonyl-CoA epimerase